MESIEELDFSDNFMTNIPEQIRTMTRLKRVILFLTNKIDIFFWNSSSILHAIRLRTIRIIDSRSFTIYLLYFPKKLDRFVILDFEKKLLLISKLILAYDWWSTIDIERETSRIFWLNLYLWVLLGLDRWFRERVLLHKILGQVFLSIRPAHQPHTRSVNQLLNQNRSLLQQAPSSLDGKQIIIQFQGTLFSLFVDRRPRRKTRHRYPLSTDNDDTPTEHGR